MQRRCWGRQALRRCSGCRRPRASEIPGLIALRLRQGPYMIPRWGMRIQTFAISNFRRFLFDECPIGNGGGACSHVFNRAWDLCVVTPFPVSHHVPTHTVFQRRLFLPPKMKCAHRLSLPRGKRTTLPLEAPCCHIPQNEQDIEMFSTMVVGLPYRIRHEQT